MPYNLSIPGQTSEHQLQAIEAVASLVPPGGTVVEVGSLFGRSSWAWAQSVDPSVTVYCIDPWEKNQGIAYMEARHGIVYGLEQFQEYTRDCANIRPLKGYSPVDFQDWATKIDLYYEDSVHVDPILSRNVEFWSGKLGAGGIICGDDFRPRFPDVMNAARRMAERFGRRIMTVEFFWCLLPSEAERPGSDAVAERLAALSAEADRAKRSRGIVISVGPIRPLPTVAAGSAPIVACRLYNDGLDPWPGAGRALEAGVRLYAADGPNDRVVAESRVLLPVRKLDPDVPIDVDLAIPADRLAPGRYRAVFDVAGPDGWLRGAQSNAPEIVVAEPERLATPVRRPLLDSSVALGDFCGVAFADSHGAFDRHLGAGLLYYALGQMVRSQVSVCIGSGGGFVPSLMRRAQLDGGLSPSTTILIDANLPELAFGSPIQAGGWMTRENTFLARENDIVVLSMLSVDAAALIAAEGLRIDHLHVDGDHSVAGVRADFEAFAPLMTETGITTFHDLRMPGVDAALAAILADRPDLEFIGFREIGAGTGLLRRRAARDVPRRPQNLDDFLDPSRRVAMDPRRAEAKTRESQYRARFERWGYLKTPAFRMRYTLAAPFVDQPDVAVVEIGGFPNTVVSVLSAARAAHLVEPYAPDAFQEEIRRLSAERGVPAFLHRTNVAAAALDPGSLGTYNMICLGLDIATDTDTPGSLAANLSAMAQLLGRARRAAVEIPGFELSQITWRHLCRLVAPRIVTDVTMDLSRDPAADEFHVKDNRASRRLILFEAGTPPDIRDPGVSALIGAAAAELWEVKTRTTRPMEAAYSLGTEIRFDRGGESSRYTRDGWVAPEARHRWMRDKASTLVFDVDPDSIDPSGDLVLRMALRPFVAPGQVPAQLLCVQVNASEVHARRIAEPSMVEVRFPARLFLERRPATVTFLHPNATRPADVVPGSTDRKPLAFAVTSLVLDAAQQP